MRTILRPYVLVLLIGGCTSSYVIRPESGGQEGSTSQKGLVLMADPQAWHAKPADLPNYMTPIAVRIVNQSGEDLRVNYVDFSLTDEKGFRYAAINPYTGSAVHSSLQSVKSRKEDRLASSSAKMKPPLQASLMLASLGNPSIARSKPNQWTADHATWRPNSSKVKPHANGQVYLVADGASIKPARHVVVAPGRRFFVHPRARLYFRYYDPWPWDFYYPPFYSTYVFDWSDTYYPNRPSKDVLQLGLPEGVLKASGEVSGFLYFQNAAQKANHLQLKWDAHTMKGKEFGVLQIPFIVVMEQ